MSKIESNPYRKRIYEFPGRIFPFEEFDEECASLRELIASRDVFCEVGSGSGRHLIELARRYPDHICLGFERRYKRAVRTLEKAIQQEIQNVYVLRTNAECISDIFPYASLCGIFVNYPDPWEKRRTHKNRILTEDYLMRCRPLIREGGFVSIKTDHREYYDWIEKEVANAGGYTIEEKSSDLFQSEFVESNITSEFEQLFLSQQLPIYYIKLRAV